MSGLGLLLLGFAMSADAFAAALSKGASLERPSLMQAIRIGLVFAVIETLTPMVGWLIGRTALPWISAWDHWVAFGLLLVLGLNMIRQALHAPQKPAPDACHCQSHAEKRQCVSRCDISLVLLALATSIDALAMGVSLSMLAVNIMTAALVIGGCTLLMATTGILVGRGLSHCGGRLIEILGGLLLIGMGINVLITHLA